LVHASHVLSRRRSFPAPAAIKKTGRISAAQEACRCARADFLLAPPTAVPVEHERIPVTAPERGWSTPYQTYRGTVSSRHELHTPEARPAVERVLLGIIETEGPIHDDLLVQRVREVWGVSRAGTRIRDNIRVVLQGLARSGRAVLDSEFVDSVREGGLKARTPERDAPRKFVHVAPKERRRALVELAAECPGISQDELVRQTCEFFGWQRVSKETRSGLEADLADLQQQGVLDLSPGHTTTER
jgi:hypothetical protein